MPPRKLMLVRHAEKQPDSGPPPFGVTADGEQNKHSLIARGWQRAGALVPFFRMPWAPGIETPDAVYASKVGDVELMADGHDVSKSLRPQQTVTPLADALAKELQTPFAVGEEQALAAHLTARESGVVLVAWEHNHIPALTQFFSTRVPDSWPGERFDSVWLLTRRADGGYAFHEVNQSLLSGDAR